MNALLALILASAGAPAMVVIDEAATVREEAPPHGAIGMSTAYRISDSVPAPRSFEFRKRALHIGAAIGVHPIDHDEIYYVVSGTGVVHSDGEEKELKAGMAAWLYKGARVGIRQTGGAPLVLIIAYPNKAPAP
ncbi:MULTISPECIES: cupin domain-containing protein [unclassified Sphingopyxis]|jgi:mannose-6-phosphate isomerase-like protein (cupin superfamily)|uniref:cupin domain-containing protein n=1 Tax=unclassified Sphingopyxis TaxID=2614943 RepID=UPI0006BFAC10|nr:MULTISPECIES: cupin domain-containing protein [unclassified Sphingopyxis]USI76963.1 cupin domain-containing protein [Sphingopyxis sp. USTB-05]GAO80591.1 rhamnogalacturonan acetylesterase [Sphingopyxis sp. C-1]